MRDGGGEALTARGHRLRTLVPGAPTGLLGCLLLVAPPCVRDVFRTPAAGVPAYLGTRRCWAPAARWRSGCPDELVRPLFLGRLSRRAGSNRVAGSWSQIITVVDAEVRGAEGRSRSGCESGVADVAERVEAAAGELASHGDQGDVGIEALAQVAVVGVVGRGGPG